MHGTIDKERMVLVHVHPEQTVCSMLADLELCDKPVAVLPLDTPAAFNYFTDLELRLFLRNVTTQEAPKFASHESLCRMAAAAASTAPPLEVQTWALVAQCQYARRAGDGTQRFKYVHGATKPAPVEDLFELPPARGTVVDLAVLAAGEAKAGGSSPSTGPAMAPPRVAQSRPAPTPLTGVPRAPANVRDAIYATCDTVLAELYQAHELQGLPAATLTQRLAAARTQALPRLAAAGVNMNSATKGSRLWLQSKLSSADQT